MKLEVQLDSNGFAPGEQLSGRILVLEGGRSRSLTLTVSFCERSPGYAAIPFSRSGVIHEGELVTGQSVDFRYEVPESALPSVRGKHGELSWELEATSDQPGLDTHARRVFEVVPAGSAGGRRSV
jgi:hypothetical protein